MSTTMDTKATPSGKYKTAGPARVKSRHRAAFLSFILLVFVPWITSTVYLYTVAHDQYASHAGFSVSKEETQSAADLLVGLTALSGSSSSDTEVLYKFIQGRQMMLAVHEKLDMERMYYRASDPVFSLTETPRTEDLEKHWSRVVKVFYDASSGLIELRVLAFDPNDAQDIAQTVLDESTRMLNELTKVARADSMSYARIELNHSVEQLKRARQAITEFRTRTQLVDPLTDIQGRTGLLTNLQTQLAEALIEQDILLASVQENDPRITQAKRRIEVIETRIAEERDRFGSIEDSQDGSYSKLVSEYEALSVDLEYAQNNYLAALGTHDAAAVDAQRQSRYLATYETPTLADSAQYPQRAMLVMLISGFLLLSWTIGILLYYSIRDRR